MNWIELNAKLQVTGSILAFTILVIILIYYLIEAIKGK